MSPGEQTERRILSQRLAGMSLFALRRQGRGALYAAYHPDASYVWNSHPELLALYPRWVRGNHANNAGDLPRLYSFILNLKQLLAEGVPGDFAELGVWRGNSAAVLAHFARTNGRRLLLFDTFAGFDGRDLHTDEPGRLGWFGDTSLEFVKGTVGGGAEYIAGFFPQSVNDACRHTRYAFVSLDCDLREPTRAGLEFFYPRMPRGGTFFLHDYSSRQWPGVADAVDEFCRRSDERVILLPDKAGTAVIRKAHD
jgi:hypothetical protein